ncbi:hypothetical protein AMAG_20493 [Allomyces macrogynus ATCC 38327]|uniref:Extracellular metalloproteinase n=1 Tax=Allomyces macrogynus (strain ATCC 38327) TaxID=578462 RepID=A0A0L0TDK0_ALLM3|nr:hypothetical protein AMAG_20493 [Allomyces macrogynus ATCC 38327]|eukprot:KNE72649.1 hypothetical protein AMAG_20493 [Allomyces macrogynus ATCC 38327]
MLDDVSVTCTTLVPVASYATGRPYGFHKYPYTTDMAVNPSTYSFLDQNEYTESHRTGEPCRPSFIDARDAFLLAEQNLTGGVNRCLNWKGFAQRGLGAMAAQGVYVNSDGVPPECEGM